MNSISEDLPSRTPSERLRDDGLLLPSANLGSGVGDGQASSSSDTRKHEKNTRMKLSSNKNRDRTGPLFNLRLWGKRGNYVEEYLSDLGVGLRRFSYAELQRASQGFAYKIGEDSFGCLYKGLLEIVRDHDGRKVVETRDVPIKVFKHHSSLGAGREELCMTEIKVMNQLRHRNLIKLLGWCPDADHLSLVYDHAWNGSLDFHLDSNAPLLPWKVRYWRIAVGLASALHYLQEGSGMCVLHRDIKPRNILLDSDFNPKLGHFGICRVEEGGDSDSEHVCSTTTAMGTRGYIDPDYLITGRPRKECDIYAFGVVALQIASGRLAINISDSGEFKELASWAHNLHEKGAILEAADPRLGNTFVEAEMERLLSAGLWCTQLKPDSRPSTIQILQLLNFQIPMPTNFTRIVTHHHSEHSNISSPFGAEQMGMMPDFLTDVEDIRYYQPDASSSPSNAIATSIGSEGVDAAAATTRNPALATDNPALAMGRVPESSISDFQDEEDDDDLDPPVVSSETTFDIGIPSNYSSSVEVGRPRKGYHRFIVNGFVDSLGNMLQSEDEMPHSFEEVLETIKRYTAFLVSTVGPPLDDWNEIAQIVLRALKEREDFLVPCDDRVAPDADVTLPSIRAEMVECSRTFHEDAEKLQFVKERLSLAQQRCDSLMSELEEAREIRLSLEEEVKVVEQSMLHNRFVLKQKRRQYVIFKQFESVLTKISSFTCEE